VEFFPEENMGLTNWSSYVHSTCYFGAGDSLRNATPNRDKKSFPI